MNPKLLIAILVALVLRVDNISAQKMYPQDDTLKVLSWNIYHLPHFIFLNSKKSKRAKEQAEELLKMDNDILVFQEAFSRKSRRIIYKRLKHRYPFAYGPANLKGTFIKTNSGIWILSNRPLIVKDEIKFDACSGIDCWAYKGSLMVEGEHNGQVFQIAGTHTNGGPQSINRHQFHQIREMMDKHQDPDIPQFVMGDMNCSYDNPTDYKAMLEVFDAKDVSSKNGMEYTSYNKIKTIDYCLVRNGSPDFEYLYSGSLKLGYDWTPVKGRKARNTVKGALGISDHMPVETHVVFKK